MGGIQTARLSNTLAQEMLYERDGEALGLTMNLLCLFAFTYVHAICSTRLYFTPSPYLVEGRMGGEQGKA